MTSAIFVDIGLGNGLTLAKRQDITWLKYWTFLNLIRRNKLRVNFNRYMKIVIENDTLKNFNWMGHDFIHKQIYLEILHQDDITKYKYFQ